METNELMRQGRTYLASRSITMQDTITAQPRLLYSRKNVAYQLSIFVRAVDYLIAANRLHTRKIGGRILVAHEELIRFAKNDRTAPMVPVSSSTRGARRIPRR